MSQGDVRGLDGGGSGALDDTPAGREVAGHDPVELPAVPGLGGLYVHAAVGAGLRAVRRRPPSALVLPTRRLVVHDVRADAAHLTAYQHLLGEPASDRLPAGFVHVLAFPLAMALITADDFPLPALGLVHVANRVVQHRPALLSDRLTISARAEHLHAHRAGTAVDLVTEASVDGEVVWTGTSTYLAKGLRLPGSTAPDAPPGPAVAPSGQPTARWHLPPDRGRAYAAVSGDRNPIHLSAATARPFGFRRAIAHGMDTAARLLAAVGSARGDAFTWSVEFAAPVLLPSTVDVRVAATEQGYSLAARRPKDGRPHVTGEVVRG